eukprot:Gb_25926 [translate_table: standard]
MFSSPFMFVRISDESNILHGINPSGFYACADGRHANKIQRLKRWSCLIWYTLVEVMKVFGCLAAFEQGNEVHAIVNDSDDKSDGVRVEGTSKKGVLIQMEFIPTMCLTKCLNRMMSWTSLPCSRAARRDFGEDYLRSKPRNNRSPQEKKICINKKLLVSFIN